MDYDCNHDTLTQKEKDEIKDAMWISFWSYYAYDAIPGDDTYLEDMSVIEEDDNRVVSGYDKLADAIVVTFRGSSNLQNWLDDFDMVKVTYTEYDCNCEVHKGFLDTYYTLKDEHLEAMKTLTAKYPSSRIIVTGHSLGAAQAQFSAIDLIKLGYTIEYYSYGSPRAGTIEFSKFFNALPFTVALRMVYQDDPVPDGPPHFMDFEHVATEVHFLDCANYIKYPEHKDDYPLADLANVDDHSMYPCLRDALNAEVLFE